MPASSMDTCRRASVGQTATHFMQRKQGLFCGNIFGVALPKKTLSGVITMQA
jgi:hypothetical protein